MTTDTRELLSGNEAIARGAIEAGISLAAAYPGTPSTEILQYLADHFDGDAEWALNEKIAYETAVGASYAGKRALCSMKHVGLNVASDPFMTSAYLGIKGGLVLVVADDPGAYSSQNEQDSRYYARFAKVPCFEPSDAQEAKDMVIRAFDLSEKMQLPVMVRTLTRVSHSLSPVTVSAPRTRNPLNLEKNPAKMLAVPSNVVRCHRELNAKYEELKSWSESAGLLRIDRNGQKRGVIASGLAYNYAREAGLDAALLKVSFYPFPDRVIEDFVRDLDEVWVLEEGEPLIEEIARKFSGKVRGKLTGELSAVGELGPDALLGALPGPGTGAPRISPPKDLPLRPPVMCQGCPHRELYKALIAAKPTFNAGDIGCYTLGASPPLRAMDTCLCMGASISKAAGISKQGVRRVTAIIGDSTFLHSGVPALISAVYNKANILVIIMDNASTAMTGHQPTPLTGLTAKGDQGGRISLEELCRACGAASVDVLDPFNAEHTEKVLREKLEADGVHVVISRKPCVLVGRKRKKEAS